MILAHLAVGALDDAAEAHLRRWLAEKLLPREPSPSALGGEVGDWFARERVGRRARGHHSRRGPAPASTLPLQPRHERRPQAPRRRRHGFSHKELLHTRRRWIDADGVREATRRVVDATLAARNPRVWHEGTTACASDSKHFGAFDKNLMAEWHARYGGRGVMIYRHVERGSVCIHARLRRRSLVHPRTLRPSCGFALAEKGHALRLIQDYLGHRDPGTASSTPAPRAVASKVIGGSAQAAKSWASRSSH
jgi:hypothetical protein